MREIPLSVTFGTEGCCGLTEIYDFPNLGSYSYDGFGEGIFTPEKPFKSDEWLTSLYKSNVEPGSDAAHFFFSHADHQKGPMTPKKFAAWLKRQGESVVATPPRRNPGQSVIVAYFWTPSKKFIDNFNKFKEKQEKNDAGSGTGY